MKVRNLLYPNGFSYDSFDTFPLDSGGWLNDPASLKIAISTTNPRTVIEVGSWKGSSANFMAKEIRKKTDDFEIVCIDTFLGSVEHYEQSSDQERLIPFKNNKCCLYDIFLSNVICENNQDYITPFQIDSVNGYLTLKSWNTVADIIYIDAAHDYYSAKNDIVNYSNLLRKGGVMVVDDYDWYMDVRNAADECLSTGFSIQGKYFWIKE